MKIRFIAVLLLAMISLTAHAVEKEGKPPKLVDLKDLDRAPVFVQQVAPVYPPDLFSEGIGGTTTVAFIIEADGSVSNAYALKESDPRFGEAGVAAAMQWKFSLPTRKKKPVKVRLQIPLVFHPPIKS